jgi:hypothetical protein
MPQADVAFPAPGRSPPEAAPSPMLARVAGCSTYKPVEWISDADRAACTGLKESDRAAA